MARCELIQTRDGEYAWDVKVCCDNSDCEYHAGFRDVD